jgi:hypothetical protein
VSVILGQAGAHGRRLLVERVIVTRAAPAELTGGGHGRESRQLFLNFQPQNLTRERFAEIRIPFGLRVCGGF